MAHGFFVTVGFTRFLVEDDDVSELLRILRRSLEAIDAYSAAVTLPIVRRPVTVRLELCAYGQEFDTEMQELPQ